MKSLTIAEIKEITRPPMAPVRTETDHMQILDTSTLPSTTLMRTLGLALTLKRGHGTATEAAFVAQLANRLPLTMIDEAGNLHVDTRHSPDNRTMFTAHTDTVHREGGINTVRVSSDGRTWYADKGSALGADDGAGVALMAHMIEAGVPGYYVFFRGEECGGIGSKWLAENMPRLFDNIDRAVAFDRADKADVITHQGMGRCCSDEFAQSLAAELSTDDHWYLPDDTGVYTDTAEFTELVAECTNLSVGYKYQHGDREFLDVAYLQAMAKQVVQVQWDSLPVKRDPAAPLPRNMFKIGTFASWNGFDKDDPLAPPTADDNDDVYCAMSAIEDALDTGDFSWLLDSIAESVWPDDPAMAARRINTNYLTEDILEHALDDLGQGHAPADVFAELYDIGARI